MKVEEFLSKRLKENGHGPFLFLGSGFSRRYVGLESWEDLLRRFCSNIKEFEYYYSSSNSDLPRAATLMANDFKDYWWSSPEKDEERKKFKDTVRYINSPLKISVSEYVKSISARKLVKDHPHADEMEELMKANVDGIITTNWDLLSETLFPDYKVFIGQDELLVSTPQNIGEIYKIHGCCTKPNSIVLTDEDYQQFDGNNPYLAAKLVTIFVENPVIFMGYSLSDPNIRSLLSSVIKGIGSKNLSKITKNLIFVQREQADRPYGFREAVYSLPDADIRVTLIVTSKFFEIYKALRSIQRKIPVRTLRYCKEQMYDFVMKTEPKQQLCVVDFENIDDSSSVEFVVGVGIIAKLGKRGYQAIKLEDIFKDIILDSDKYDSKTLLETTVQTFSKQTKYVPVYKYLKKLGIDTKEGYDTLGLILRPVDEFNINDYRNKQYVRFFSRECKGMGVNEIINAFYADKAAILIPFIPWRKVDIDALKDFISENLDKVSGKNSRYSTFYRRLICMYDAIVNGWYC